MATTKDVPLTNDEIWDDSALVDSWNSALEEYKKYHSIHTKGGNVVDLLEPKKSESNSNNVIAKATNEASTSQDTGHDTEMASDEPRNETQASTSQPNPPPRLAPEVVLGSVQDESLKRLLMSWYYAGYYTGLYEGQQGQNGQGRG